MSNTLNEPILNMLKSSGNVCNGKGVTNIDNPLFYNLQHLSPLLPAFFHCRPGVLKEHRPASKLSLSCPLLLISQSEAGSAKIAGRQAGQCTLRASELGTAALDKHIVTN